MQNDNFDRLYNLPPCKKSKHQIDWEDIAAWIFMILAIMSFSLVSYDFWSAIVELFS